MHAAASALLAVAAAAGGLVIAGHHPLWPVPATAAFIAWCAVAAWRPQAWLAVVPAVLPFMNLAPWTGWIAFDEFDLVVLGALAGGHARLAVQRDAGPAWPRLALPWFVLAVAALVHGTLAAQGPAGWFDGETDPLNAWRVFKGPFHALLAAPLLRRAFQRDPEAAMARIAAGMQVGVAIVVGAALWERAAYPGLFDPAADYRIVALFWEMHLGGAAIDAYVALAVPFAAHAAMRAATTARWMAAAVLAIGLEYTVLMTHSRGACVAAAAALLAYIVLQRRLAPPAPAPRWRIARRVLLAVLVAEAAAILAADSLVLARARRTPLDVGTRLAHWSHGLALLQGPVAWAFGNGLGRLPADYAAAVPAHDLSGAVHAVTRDGAAWATLEGPARTPAWGGLYALTQRVPPDTAQAQRVHIDMRADRPTRVGLSVCELHLLYPRRCVRAVVVAGTAPGWATQSVSLPGDGPSRPPPGRSRVFGVSVLDVGGHVDIDNVALERDGRDVLRNGDFAQGLARWYPAARRYFVPWHIDSLPLELLIEQGIAGLAAFVVLVTGALRALRSPSNPVSPWAPVLVTSLLAALLVGLVNSVLDVPRVAFLLFVLILVPLQSVPAPDTRSDAR
jgi:hypothetical protein